MLLLARRMCCCSCWRFTAALLLLSCTQFGTQPSQGKTASPDSDAPPQVLLQLLEVESRLRWHRLCAPPPGEAAAAGPVPSYVPALHCAEYSRVRADLEAIPPQFVCPLSLALMTSPVTAPSGITYNRCVRGLLYARAATLSACRR